MGREVWSNVVSGLEEAGGQGCGIDLVAQDWMGDITYDRGDDLRHLGRDGFRVNE